MLAAGKTTKCCLQQMNICVLDLATGQLAAVGSPAQVTLSCKHSTIHKYISKSLSAAGKAVASHEQAYGCGRFTAAPCCSPPEMPATMSHCRTGGQEAHRDKIEQHRTGL